MSSVETWKTWEGRVVDGKFPLRKWLGGSDHSAVFLTERPGQASQKIALKLTPADPKNAERQLSAVRAATQISHPHLIRLLEAGRCSINGTPVIYVAMEYAEEDLSQILPQRALTPDEVADLLPPLLDALSYLHGKGFVHGDIRPSNVLAVGDQLKLSADQLIASTESQSAGRRDVYDAPETAAGIVSPAGDLWSIGVTLVTTLTQNVPFAGDAAGDPRVPESIPEPFRGIARECLHLDPKQRCSIANIQARLQPAGRSVPAEPEAPADPTQHQRFARRKFIPFAILVVVAGLLAAVSKIFMSKPAGKTEPVQITVVPEPATTVAPPLPIHESEPPKRAATAKSEVVHQVLPDIPQSAKKTITGTLKVSVRVEVDSSGKVTTAKLASPGPSEYFAKLSLKAAQRWEFSPPEVNGQPEPSAWLLRFRFKRTSTQVSPERAKP